MPEGLATAAGIAQGVHDDPDTQPPPGPGAPRGWTWNRKDRRWTPRQRGQIMWSAGDASDDPPAQQDGDGAEPADGRQRDPDPAWIRGKDKEPGARPDKQPDKQPWDPKSVPAEVRDDIGGMLGLVATVLLPPLEKADPHCGGALADSFDRIVDKAIPLVCRSERVVKWMQAEGGGFMDWIGFAIACGPVARAVAEHHIVRTVEVVEEKDEETGKVTKVAQPVDFSQYQAA